MKLKEVLHMLTVAYDGKLNKYTRQLVVSKVDNEILLKAKTSFNRYREKNIILNGLFDDNTWLVCDEKYRYTIDFDYDEDLFLYNAGKWIGCDSECYRKCIKAYVVFNFGNLMLESLHRLAREFSLIAGYELEHVLKICEYPNHLAELLKILPDESESRDYIIEQIEDNIQFGARKQKPNNQRLLADFNSYLNFDECLNEYWSVAPDQKKLFYFPIFFWWKLTSILPLRPTEYLLTPRNCLQMNSNGENVITIRRTKLKGGQTNITYKIDGDYEKKKYIIPHMLADEIKKYVIMTDEMKLSNIGTLISRQPYCESIKFSSKIADKFFTYSDLSLTLDCFLSELKRNDIKVRLGDTRHIAMASLIISGGSPTICKELAGHSDINISSHYYSNISNLIECMVLNQYRKVKGDSPIIQGKEKYGISLPVEKHRVLDGWCDCMEVIMGNVNECLKSIDKDGHIANCNCCSHYWPDVQGLRLDFYNKQRGKSSVDFDCQFLMKMIELVRKGIGCEENIQQALLKLQKSSFHYANCLREKYEGGNI